MPERLPILLYHDLESPGCPNEKTDAAAMDTVVILERFRAQLKILAESGYRSLTLGEYFQMRERGDAPPPRSIVLTFDDGHYSAYRLAFSALREYGFRGVFFVVAGRLDEAYHLTRVQLRQMADEGMEIGSHGLTHRFLPIMSPDEIAWELGESREILELATGRPVEFFAFPGGHYDATVLTALSAGGYRGACSCLQGLNDSDTPPYLLKRVEIRRRVELPQFKNAVNPAHLAVYRFIDAWKQAVRSGLGLERYSRIRSRLYHLYPFRR